MSLQVIHSYDQGILNDAVRRVLRDAIVTQGSAVLLVPSFSQALDVQRELARDSGLSLGVQVTTPAAWVKERWEVWGDGRALADDVVLSVLARQVIVNASSDELGPMLLSAGLVDTVVRLANSALPWLPLDDEGVPRHELCMAAGITHTETLLVGLAGTLGKLLARKGYITRAQAFWDIPQLLAQSKAAMPAIVVAGFGNLGRPERELLRGMSEIGQVTLVLSACGIAAKTLATRLVQQLRLEGAIVDEGDDAPHVGQIQEPEADRYGRDARLCILRECLYSGSRVADDIRDVVSALVATGPIAEAELVVSKVEELLREYGENAHGTPVVVTVPDLVRAHRELMPKLAARGITAHLAWGSALHDVPALQAFLSFAYMVANLDELAQTWPEPQQGLEGPVPQLGDMSWWPPQELTDFLLSGISGMDAAAAWRLDALWRGNRVLKPSDVLDTLQSEKDTSTPVARATAELLRGRVGSAASKLLLPFVQEGAPTSAGAEEAKAALQAVLRIAGTLRELGVSADPAVEDSLPLIELVRLCDWAAQGMQMVGREGVGNRQAVPQVKVMSVGEAARLAPGSASVLVMMGCTTTEQPVSASDDLLTAMLERLDVEPAPDSMGQKRDEFARLLGVPAKGVIVERSLVDADGGETYPAVMLAELLTTLGIDPGTSPTSMHLATTLRAETELAANRLATGGAATVVCEDDPAPAGRLGDAVRGLVFVPQAGKERLEGDVPVLSASQIETYLDCPYKWFSLRRLRLGSVDAGHTGMEMGTFAHRVLEKTHGTLFARALGADDAVLDEKALRALGEEHLTDHIPGSAVDQQNLAAATSALELEFDLHQQHMRMVKRPRLNQQLLVPHNSLENAQEQALRDDLISCLDYQTRILQGFEPRLFEWGFGRHEELVSYAGAYFTGTVDRIDVNPHGMAVIIDYKHKSPVGFAQEYDALQEGVLEGELLPNRVQSLIYAQVVRRAFEGRLRLVGSVYLSTKSPHALAGVADAHVADLVFGKIRADRQERVCVPRTAAGEPGMNDLLDRTEELVAQQVAQMLAGNVEARPRDKRSCDFCPVMQCERRVAR